MSLRGKPTDSYSLEKSFIIPLFLLRQQVQQLRQ
jgi:hypothetical protein